MDLAALEDFIVDGFGGAGFFCRLGSVELCLAVLSSTVMAQEQPEGWAGYDFVIGPVVVRPYLTDGLLVHSAKQCTDQYCGRETENALFAGIGA